MVTQETQHDVKFPDNIKNVNQVIICLFREVQEHYVL